MPGALQRIDMLLCATVEHGAQPVPPQNPVPGACYLVGDGASGAWAGRDGSIAGHCEGGWRFVEPVDGMSVLARDTGETIARTGGSWVAGVIRGRELRIEGQPVVRARQPAIAPPTSGNTVDVEARSAVANIIAALSAHGLIAQ